MFFQHLDAATAVISSLQSLAPEMEKASALIIETLRNGGKVMSCGNGGSAAEAAHFSTELLCRLEGERPSLPCINLTADGSFLSAAGNDYHFNQVFARQIEGLGRKGDTLLILSTSGQSPNILAAVHAARSRGMKTVALLGKGGGEVAPLVDVALTVASDRTMHVQEAHLVLIHVLCWQIEHAMFPTLP